MIPKYVLILLKRISERPAIFPFSFDIYCSHRDVDFENRPAERFPTCILRAFARKLALIYT